MEISNLWGAISSIVGILILFALWIYSRRIINERQWMVKDDRLGRDERNLGGHQPETGLSNPNPPQGGSCYSGPTEPAESDSPPTTDMEINTNAEGYQPPWADCTIHLNIKTGECHYDGDPVVADMVSALMAKSGSDEACQVEDTWGRFMNLEIELPMHPIVLVAIYDALQFQISQGLPMPIPFERLLHIMNRADTEKYSALMDCYAKDDS